MKYFKQYLETEQTNVFKNMKYLDPECIPQEFHFRDNEMATIAENIAPCYMEVYQYILSS